MKTATLTSLFLASLLALFLPSIGFAESASEVNNRLNGRYFNSNALDCGFGNASTCAQLRAGATSGVAAVAALSPAQQDAKVESWVERALGKISQLQSSGALGILGMFGAGPLLGKVQAVLGALQANHGDIKQALSGGLMPLVQDLLGTAKQIVVQDGLGNGSRIDQLQQQLPQLANQVLSGQMNTGQLLTQLTAQYGSDPLVQRLEHAFGGLSGTSSPGQILQAVTQLH